LDGRNEYFRVYAVPYRFVIEDDSALLTAYLQDHGTGMLNTLASLALIHDRVEILDVLIVEYAADIDIDRLFLLSCLFAREDLFARFEDGSYGFDINEFISRDGVALFNHAAASGNVPFFEALYSKYYQMMMSNLSKDEKESFFMYFWGWAMDTGNDRMLDIVLAIEEGTYNGK
jgi:hypothetical protein